MEKIDLKRELKQLYSRSARGAQLVDVPTMSFLMIDGRGDPNSSPEYAQALETLYSVAYTLKFMVKQGALGIDYGVMPLEGLWWADNMDEFLTGNKSNWQWTAMIMQPDFVTVALFEEAVKKAQARKGLPAAAGIRLEGFAEGRAAQIVYVGPYSAEGPTIETLHRFISESGHEIAGKHHEIYLSDPRKSPPDRLITIIRQPVQPAGAM